MLQPRHGDDNDDDNDEDKDDDADDDDVNNFIFIAANFQH